MTEKDVIAQSPRMVFREEGDGAFLFDPDTGNLKFVNAMGVRIYRMCSGGVSVGEIVSSLVTDYPRIPEGQVREDVTSFLEEMTKMELLLIGES